MRAILFRLSVAALAAPLSFAGLALAPGGAHAGAEAVGNGNFVFIPPPVVFVPPTATPPGPPPAGPGPITVTPGATQNIVANLNSAINFCGRLSQDVYTVDCLSDQLERVARSMPDTGDYADARAALMTAARRLHALADQYGDPTKGRSYVKSTGKDGTRSTRPLTPVRPDAMPEVRRKAIAIIAETRTVLLRSASDSERRKVPYERIAAAVGSADKVLLRST